MHKTENFSLTNNLDVSAIKETSVGGAYYALVKISLLGMDNYGILTLGGGYSFESVGGNISDAIELFELVVNDAPAVEHMFDIVSDFRREKMIDEL